MYFVTFVLQRLMVDGQSGVDIQIVVQHVTRVLNQELEHAPIPFRPVEDPSVLEILWRPKIAFLKNVCQVSKF